MVRGLGLGFSKAVSATAHEDVIKQQEDYDRLVDAGVTWFGHILDYFKAPTLPDGTRDARVFTDPDLVVRAVPVKVALGVMGNPWFEVNRPEQAKHKKALEEIDWRVSMAWQGIAGKVSPKVETRKTEGKTTRVTVEGKYKLAAAGAKEIGAATFRALTIPDSNPGLAIRGKASDRTVATKKAAAVAE